MRHAYNEGWKKRNNGRIELLNQERIRMVEEKESNKYLWILKAETIKQTEMKEKKKEKSTSDERESFSKPSPAKEISSKGLTIGLLSPL